MNRIACRELAHRQAYSCSDVYGECRDNSQALLASLSAWRYKFGFVEMLPLCLTTTFYYSFLSRVGTESKKYAPVPTFQEPSGYREQKTSSSTHFSRAEWVLGVQNTLQYPLFQSRVGTGSPKHTPVPSFQNCVRLEVLSLKL